MYKRFIVHCYQQSLHWFLTITEPSGILIRWSLRLVEFYFKYNTRKLNDLADALSRLKTSDKTTLDFFDEILFFPIDEIKASGKL